MPRSRATAKKAGASFERLVADYFALHIHPAIDRQVKRGNKDIGDVRGVVNSDGQKVCIEAKNVVKPALPEWTKEAETERQNLNALAGVVVHKRFGSGKPEEQWVSMTLGELVALLKGNRDHLS